MKTNRAIVVAAMAALVVGMIGVVLRPRSTRPGDQFLVSDDRNIHWSDGILPKDTGNVLGPPPPPGYNPTKAESNELAQAFCDVAEAYTNGSLQTLREKMAKVPDTITNVIDSVFIDLQRPWYVSFDEGFLYEHKIRDFDNVREFADFAERNVAMVRFLGEIYVKRGAYSGFLLVLDMRTLRRLVEYREKFRKEGKHELEARADEFVREWCEQIESENGYTHSYVRFFYLLQTSGGIPAEPVVRSVRRKVGGVIAAGYTPKWLDKEFPLPAEYKGAKGAGASDNAGR